MLIRNIRLFYKHHRIIQLQLCHCSIAIMFRLNRCVVLFHLKIKTPQVSNI